ncbi:hypothetical protein scyTo_0024644, partial [Scyliorhinus torazame]|nr:hypothetical protein [Scyliorhinus torazame]
MVVGTMGPSKESAGQEETGWGSFSRGNNQGAQRVLRKIIWLKSKEGIRKDESREDCQPPPTVMSSSGRGGGGTTLAAETAPPAGSVLLSAPPRSRIYKIIVIGDSGVGKTCLTYRFCAGSFPDKTEATIGVDFRERTVEIDGEKIK